ncbi:hypothetical protein P7L75_23765 [Tistrella mobilis]|uniref:hypothetical protein n=1 Tax=Tistrella mobilis TaxID=171437 RepID=UPI003558B6C2
MPPPKPAGTRRYLITLAATETPSTGRGLAAAAADTARRARGLQAEAERLGLADHLVWIGPPTAFGMVPVACSAELVEALRTSPVVARIEAEAD